MTTIELPKGFLTRPEAAKIFNRSQRALERDLDKALTRHDEKSLAHWKLVTKDGAVREALGLSTELVDNLVSDGMVPTWCVAESFLEETFGKKGMPSPSLKSSSRDPSEKGSRVPDEISSPRGKRGEEAGTIASDVTFLQERIRTLEREKQEEVERNERREAKLFAELDVKNKQIAAWDEISQGLTKALATGQITPRLIGGMSENRGTSQVPAMIHVHEEPHMTTTIVKAAAAEVMAQPVRERGESWEKRTTPKRSTKLKSRPVPSLSLFEKHTPTFHKVVSHFLSRS